MATANISTVDTRVTEQHVIQVIADALDVPPSRLTLTTKASDIPEWDSMGMLSILSSLDREGVKCDIGNSESLQTVKGVIEAFRVARRGKLE